FAQAVVSGMNQSDAYRSAYDVRPDTKAESVNVSASQLMSDPKISQRVDELRKPVIKKAQMTLESHLARLQSLSESAEADKQFSASISAEVARGKASGVAVDKSQMDISVTFPKIINVIAGRA
ncbi:hypothetical protein UFOVP1470_1, partial [uncultured Caudovirales phage]